MSENGPKMEVEHGCNDDSGEARKIAFYDVDHEVDCAGAFYSNDFEWESLRAEIEESSVEECTGNAETSRGSLDFAPSAWEAFHNNHSKSLFFKERRYLIKEFPELLSVRTPTTRILEVGCGTGSSVVPILSATALERATEQVTKQAGLSESQIHSFHPFLCDISLEALPSWLCCSCCRKYFKHGEIPNKEQLNDCTSLEGNPDQNSQFLQPENCCLGGVSIVTLIFTLSAVPLESMHFVLAEIWAVLRPGGGLMFRDYGLYDMSMLRFPLSQKVSNRLYHRKDGTLAYFFTIEVVRDLFTKVGFVEEELHYCCVQLLNRRKQLPMKRVWIHGKFRKPLI